MRILAHHDNFQVQRDQHNAALPAQYSAANFGFLAHRDFTNIIRNAPGAYGGFNFGFMIYTPSARANNYQLDMMCILALTATYNLSRDQINRLKTEISAYDDRNKNIDYILLNTPVMQEVIAARQPAPAQGSAEVEKAIQLGLGAILKDQTKIKIAPAHLKLIMNAYNNPGKVKLTPEALGPIAAYLTQCNKYFKTTSYVQLLAGLNPQPVQRVNPALDGMKAEAQESYNVLFSLFIRASEQNRTTAERVFGRQAIIFGGNIVPINANGFMPAAVRPQVNPNAGYVPNPNPAPNPAPAPYRPLDPFNPFFGRPAPQLGINDWMVSTVNGVVTINGVGENDPRFADLLNRIPVLQLHALPQRLWTRIPTAAPARPGGWDCNITNVNNVVTINGVREGDPQFNIVLYTVPESMAFMLPERLRGRIGANLQPVAPNPAPAPVVPNPAPAPVRSPVLPPQDEDEIEIPDDVIAGFYSLYETSDTHLSVDDFVAVESARYRFDHHRPQVQQRPNPAPQNVAPARVHFTYDSHRDVIEAVLEKDNFYPAEYRQFRFNDTFPHQAELLRLKDRFKNGRDGFVVKMLLNFNQQELEILFKLNHNNYANGREMRIRKDYKKVNFVNALYNDNEKSVVFYNKMMTRMGYQNELDVDAALRDLFEALDFEAVNGSVPGERNELAHYLVMRAALLATAEYNNPGQNPAPLVNPNPNPAPQVNPKHVPPVGALVLPPRPEAKKNPPVAVPVPQPEVPVVAPVVSETLSEANRAAVLDKIVSDNTHFDSLHIPEGQKIDMLNQRGQYAQSVNKLKAYYANDDLAILMRCLAIDQLDQFFVAGMYPRGDDKLSSFLRAINNGVDAIPASLKQRMLADDDLEDLTDGDLKNVIRTAIDHIDLTHVSRMNNTVEDRFRHNHHVLHYLIKVAAVQSVFE